MTWQSGWLLSATSAGGSVVALATGLVPDRLRSAVRNAVAAALGSVGAWASAAAVRYGDGGSTRSRAAAASVAGGAAVDAATEGLIVVDGDGDGDGVVVACNAAAADALGHGRRAALGEPIEALDPELAALTDDSTDGGPSGGDAADGGAPADHDALSDAEGPERGRLVADAVRDVTGTAGSTEGRDEPARLTRMTDEGKRHYDVRVDPFERPDHRGRVLALRDVTDRHRLRRRIGVLNRLLRHDLRNEMNVVLGYVERMDEPLREGAGPGDAAVDGEMETAIDRITGAAETMLDRAETVRHVESTLDADSSARTRLDVVGLVRAQVDGMAVEYRSIDPQVTVDAPDSAWITATGLVDTVFENLLENAIEHSHRERPDIEISVEDSEPLVAVTVADDGPGIPGQELQTFRTESETAVTHSSGLGLWLVVWITEASGGRVSFDVDETGTAVTVEFPAADPPE